MRYIKRGLQHLVVWILISAILTGCAGAIAPTPEAAIPSQFSAGTCPNLLAIAHSFYDANDAAHYDTSLTYLTEDVILATWAEGANGHHVSLRTAVGKEQVRPLLEQMGLRRLALQPDQPNFHEEQIQIAPNQITFRLSPDHTHPDGRPYNPYWVELFFSGCKIEILKIVERVTWL